jgi:hypothetical protein
MILFLPCDVLDLEDQLDEYYGQEEALMTQLDLLCGGHRWRRLSTGLPKEARRLVRRLKMVWKLMDATAQVLEAEEAQSRAAP